MEFLKGKISFSLTIIVYTSEAAYNMTATAPARRGRASRPAGAAPAQQQDGPAGWPKQARAYAAALRALLHVVNSIML